MISDLKNKMCEAMDQTLERLRQDLIRIRTGRATLSILDGVMVNYYNTPTPLKQVSALAIPEPQMITVQPWDVSLIPEVEKAITGANLGLNPMNDGKLIRLMVPPPTEERRKEMVKGVKKMAEDTKIGVRNARREANDQLKKLLKESRISEDDHHKEQGDVQKTTDQYINRVDEMIRKKEAELLEV